MGKVIRFLVIYTALISTATLVAGVFFVQTATDSMNKSALSVEDLQKQLKTLSLQKPDNKLSNEIDKIKSQLAAETKVLGTTESSPSAEPSVGFVTINDKKWEVVSIYEAKSYTSKVLGKADFGKQYLFLKKEDSWYQITLPSNNTTGWVSARFFKEISSIAP